MLPNTKNPRGVRGFLHCSHLIQCCSINYQAARSGFSLFAAVVVLVVLIVILRWLLVCNNEFRVVTNQLIPLLLPNHSESQTSQLLPACLYEKLRRDRNH